MRLKASELGFHYRGEAWLFRQLTIEVWQGEIVGVFGPSGCGKSTLARIIAGYVPPIEGKIEIKSREGQAVEWMGGKANPVQMVFQHPEHAVNPRWRIKDVLYESWRPDDLLLKSLGMEQSWLHRRPDELSLGQLQRVCIARALRPETRFLIADEMTAMLDAITQAQIWNTVLTMATKRKIGIIVISHDEKLLQRLCDRIIYWD